MSETAPLDHTDLLLRVYLDAKALLGRIGHATAQPFLKRREAKMLLESFHPDFAHHPPEKTKFVDYYTWHESDADWHAGNGLLTMATYNELARFWAVPEFFVPYEAKLRRYIRSGGEVRRVFIIGSEIRDPRHALLLYRTLKRHMEMNFQPKVLSVLDMRSIKAELGVHCETVAAFHGRIAYFLSDDEPPLMLRSLDDVLAVRIQNKLVEQWNKATPAKQFLRRLNLEIPVELEIDLQLDIQAIEALAQ